MPHHLDARDRFQSDKHPELKPDHVILDLADPNAQRPLWDLALNYGSNTRVAGGRTDPDFGGALVSRLLALGFKP